MGIMHEVAVAAGHALSGLHAGVDKLAGNRIEAPETIQVQSSSFEANHPLSSRYAKEGEDLSPALRITGTPEGAHELVVLCEDPDAPFPSPFVHWLVYGIRPDAEVVFPEGAGNSRTATSYVQGKNGEEGVGYTGAAPPPGHGVHHYYFQVFALDAPLVLAEVIPSRDELVEAMKGHVMAKGELVGTYERN